MHLNERFKFIILVVVIAALAGVYILLQSQDGPGVAIDQAAAVKNSPAPDFTLMRLDGEIVHLKDYRGKVVFLNIWATWCPPCREEMPAMEKLYRKMKGEAFEILAVSIDEAGVRDVGPFVKKNNLSFPVLLDVKGVTKALYGIIGIPETFVIDKNGIIVSKIIGSMDWAGAESVQFFKDLARSPDKGKE